MAVISAQANKVSLIADNVNQFVLTKQAAERGKGLAFFLADFYRNANVLSIRETKAEQGMGRAAPVGKRLHHKPHCFQFA